MRIYIFLNTQTSCRLAVRSAAAVIQKFAGSIAPHITTILVHGKQVICRWGIQPLHVWYNC